MIGWGWTPLYHIIDGREGILYMKPSISGIFNMHNLNKINWTKTKKQCCYDNLSDQLVLFLYICISKALKTVISLITSLLWIMGSPSVGTQFQSKILILKSMPACISSHFNCTTLCGLLKGSLWRYDYIKPVTTWKVLTVCKRIWDMNECHQYVLSILLVLSIAFAQSFHTDTHCCNGH